MSWEMLIGLLALVISLLSLTLAIVFYFKSDRLYKEMLKFVAEIRIYSETMYKDTVGMVKEGWSRFWDKGFPEEIGEVARVERDKIKTEISEEMKKEIELIKNSDFSSVEELKGRITKLQSDMLRSMEELGRRMKEVDESVIQTAAQSPLDLVIIDFVKKHKKFNVLQLFATLKAYDSSVSPLWVIERLNHLKEQKKIDFRTEGGRLLRGLSTVEIVD